MSEEMEMDWDDPVFVAAYREAIEATIKDYETGKDTSSETHKVYMHAQERFPGDRERQVDLMMCVSEMLLRSQAEGSGPGEVQHGILVEIATKYKMEAVFIEEILGVLLDKVTGILK